MRCAQIDSFPQNPAEPIPAGRASPCWHIVAWFGTTAYPLSLSYDRCLALPCLAMPCHATQCLAVPRSVWMLPHPSRQRHARAGGLPEFLRSVPYSILLVLPKKAHHRGRRLRKGRRGRGLHSRRSAAFVSGVRLPVGPVARRRPPCGRGTGRAAPESR